MKNWILEQVTRGRTSILFIAAHALFASMWIFTIPKLHALTDPQLIFDIQPTGYDLTYAKQLLHALGTEGRDMYLKQQLILDQFYPVLYALSYSFLFLYLLKRVRPTSSWHLVPAVLPWLAAAFDYAENWCIRAMLLQPDELTENMVATSSRLTLTKAITITFFFLLFTAFLLRHWIVRYRKSKLGTE